MRGRLSAGLVALAYAVFGCLWITASDWLVGLLIDSPAMLLRVELFKGAGFVLFTSSLFYFFLRTPQERGESDVRISARRGQRFILLTFFGLALGAPLLGYAIFRLYGPQVELEAFANLTAVVRLKVQVIENWLAERQGDSQALASSPGLAALMARQAEDGDTAASFDIHARLENLRRAYAYDHVLAYDTSGRLLVAAAGEGSIPKEPPVLLLQALRQDKVQFTDVYREESGATHLDWIVPVAVAGAPAGRPVGAIVLHAAPERFLFPFLQTWPAAGRSAESLLVRRDGDGVLILNGHRGGAPLSERIPLTSREHPAVKAVLDRQADISYGIDSSGKQVLAAYQSVNGTGWRLITKIDRDEVLEPVGTLVAWVSLFAFFTVIFTSAALLALWRQRQRAHRWELTAQTAAAVAESESRLRAIIDNAPASIFMKDTEGRFILANKSFLATCHLTEAQLLGKTDHDLFSPDLAHVFSANDRRVLQTGVSVETEDVAPDGGQVRTFLSVKFPLRRQCGEIYAICGIATDISQRKEAEAKIQRLTRFYAALSQCNQAIVRCRDEQELFAEICCNAVRYGGWKLAWIGLVDQDSGKVRPVACFGQGADYVQGIEVSVSADSPFGTGPVGTAIRENRPCWIQDFLHDPSTGAWHARAAPHGWKAAASLPIHRQGAPVGAFTLYTEHMDAFDEAVRELLVEMAADISFALAKFDLERERQSAEKALRESEALFHTLAMAAPVGIFRADLNGRCIFVNRTWCEITGTASEQACGQQWDEAVAEVDRAKIRAAWESSHRTGRALKAEYRLRGPEGALTWVMGQAEAEHDAAGKVKGYIGTITDITELKLQQERLRQASVVFENSREGIMVTDADERIVLVNRAFTAMTGYAPAESLGRTPRLLKSGRHDREFYANVWHELRETGHWQGEMWNRRKNGEIYPELLSISAVLDESGKAVQYVGIFADISQIKDAADKLDYLAHHDPLTGLPNRIVLFARLQHSLGVTQRERKRLALLMLDLDRFKDVNDSFGHLAGDELLQQVAKRLSSRLRGVDTVTRLGGDEFAVLLEDLSHPQDAAQIAWEIITTLNEPWRLANGVEVRVGTSIGIALSPEHGETSEELLQHADAALNLAKEEGRGSFKYYSDDLTHAARRRINLESLLRRAIRREELRVFYQPQIHIASGAIVGAEALLRWQDPAEGLILPGNFISVAEQTGLIDQIGEWVLRETCRQGKEWLSEGLPPLKLAVNLSPHQFRYGDIRVTVANVLAETGFPAERLELELTESALMERATDVVLLLRGLRQLGVRLAIDDFGTGYSSLAYLKRFPLDVLKIDKTFIDDIPFEHGDMEIAAAIIALGHTLQLKVLAEGVETREQLEFLRGKGCDLYQGYLLSKPVPAAEFRRLVGGAGQLEVSAH